ncbi:MAG: penicillin-binding transpeptidase domain-containing protein [Clostridiales bacterium]|nr:penicillin-binding transpeptidase domain-containing protein [Clostridiales bacterium]
MKLPSLNGIKKKSIWIIGVLFFGFAAVIVRMAWWQLIRGSELADTAKRIQTADTIEKANRGTIYDRNGMVLAESASVKTLVCNPQEIGKHGDLNACISLISPIIGISDTKLRAYFTEDVQYRVIKKRLAAEESDQIEAMLNPEYEDEKEDGAKARNEEKKRIKNALSGVYFENDTKRYYPYNVASHVLGFTGYDSEGLQGVEKKFDEYLSGENGAVSQNRTASGADLTDQQAEYLTAAKKGCNVTLTIDETLQHFLETHLEEAVQKNELKEGAAGIIMNPKTGEILAMATKPDFDCNNPNDLTQFLEYAYEFEPVYEDDSSDPDATERPTEDPNNLSDTYVGQARTKMWRDKCISDTYEPGSTFKIITAAAALEENVVSEGSNFFCSGFKIVADRKIECANHYGHGAQSFADGVKNSCNPVFMEVGLAMGANTFMDYFKAFGLTGRTGVDLVGEASGIYYDTMSEVDLATSSFGQGFQVTPLQLVTAISAVVNGGQRMRPLIVKNITNKEGVVKSYEPEVVNRVISEQTSERMRSILEQVVSDPNATGKNAYVKGCRIGGKTGTSEKGNRELRKRIASFVGFAPANDPELVCLVMLDEPQTENKYGGTIAAPIVGEVLAESLDYMGVSKQYSDTETPDIYVEVPELRGQTLSEAKASLEDKKLKYVVKGTGETVVDQLPAPDEQLEEDSVVIIYTQDRDETDKVKVPDLKGTSVSDAKYILNNRGLNFEISGAGHSEASNAFAISQTVESGTEVLPGSVIGVEFRQQTND